MLEYQIFLYLTCLEKMIMLQIFFLDLGVIDCVWNAYEEWTSCSKDCGGGKRSRARTIKIAASNGGQECSGPTVEEEDCNTHGCVGNDYYRVFM